MNRDLAAKLWHRAQGAEADALEEIFRTLDRGLGSSSDELAELWSVRPSTAERAHRVGLVGPPGAGKSSLLAQLAAQAGSRAPVGVVSIDATGATGAGARLGDRLRMNEVSLDDYVHTRTVDAHPGGPPPGLLASTAADVFESIGCERVYVESVGLARAQVEIVRRVHTVVLVIPATVESPERLVEAGLLDLADLVVLNKCDMESAEEVAATLDRALAEHDEAASARPGRVFRTQANRGAGVDLLHQAITDHATSLRADGQFASRSRAQVAEQLRQVFFGMLQTHWATDVGLRSLLDEAAQEILSGDRSVLEVAEEVAEQAIPPRR